MLLKFLFWKKFSFLQFVEHLCIRTPAVTLAATLAVALAVALAVTLAATFAVVQNSS